MDSLLKELLDQQFGQQGKQKMVYVSLIILLVGLPYIVRVWRELFASKASLERSKLQLELLKVYTDICNLPENQESAEVKKKARAILDSSGARRSSSTPLLRRLLNGLGAVVVFAVVAAATWTPFLLLQRSDHVWFARSYILLTIIFLGAYAEQSSNKKATAYRAAIFAGMASLIVINFIVLLGSVDISIFGIWQLPHFE